MTPSPIRSSAEPDRKVTITRRRLLMTATAALGLPPRLWATTTLQAGMMRIDTVSDGSLVLSPAVLFGQMPQEKLQAILEHHGEDLTKFTPPCNVTLYRDGTHVVLFDAGAGPDFQPSAGRLIDSLAVLGLAPDDVTHVLFTHGHPDHLWGVIDAFDEPVFSRARYMMGRIEHDYWADPATVARIDEGRKGYAVGAARRLAALAEWLELFEDGAEVLPGITARLTPGHTPGHVAYALAGPAPALVLGDCLSNHHVAFERPDWPTGSDQDTAAAAATRIRLLAEVADTGLTLIGYHLPGGGLGRAEAASAGGYVFRPLQG